MNEIIQGSAEWHQMRLGKVTASKVADVMAKIKTGEAAARRNYRAQLVAERLSKCPTETFQSAAMAWGIEMEDNARQLYSFLSGHEVEQVAFVDHPVIAMSGASPDGLIGTAGMVEIKCPNTATHIDYLLAGEAPSQYIPQLQWQLACTGRSWVDFVSYDPRLPDDLQILIVRVARDDEYIVALEAEVVSFLESVNETVEKLLKLRKAA